MSARGRQGDVAEELPEAPERYELATPAAHQVPMDRRAFFRALGGGVVVASVVAAAEARAQESGGGGRRGGPQPERPRELGAWLHIGADGVITVFTGKVEVGQDIRTSLTQAVLEELPAAPEAVKLVMGDTGLTPFDAGTFGSRTTPAMAPQLRKVAATARRLLAARAAARWGVPPDAVTVEAGKVVHAPSKRAATFGALTKGQRLIEVIEDDVATRPADAWTVAGRSMTKVDARAVVTGQRKYTSDLRRPGMLVGKVLRPPRFGARLAGLDGAAAAAMKGVKVVHEEAERGFAGVVARDETSASEALAALRPTWNLPDAPAPRGDQLFAGLRAGGASAGAGGRADERDRGDVDRAFAQAAHRLAASYEVAYIAHAPLEPRAAVAEWQGRDRLTVWTGTQRPFGVRRELAQAFALPEDSVRVIAADTGSGYGGKHTGEAAVEAARLARAAGKPVRLVWSREEEFTWAYFRPAGVIDVRGAVDGGGRLVAWEARNYNSGASGLRTPYDVANQRHRFVQVEAPLRQGSYRGLAAVANHFAREVHMDELAGAVKQDPLAFRERNLTDARLLAVLRAAAERFGWARRGTPAAGAGFGLACGLEKGGYVASCVELSAGAQQVTVRRVVTAFECGAIVNPDHLTNQVEGAVIMGLGGALTEAIDFADGTVLNPRFSDYQVPRFADVPRLETVLVNRPDLPAAGAGETPIVAIAPAIANALAAATGKRPRALPMRLA